MSQKAKLQSEKRFQQLLALIPDSISIHDTDMNIVYSNWRGFRVVPEEKKVLNTKCYRTYRGLDDICPDCQAVTVLQTGESLRKEVELPEGIWVEVRVIPIPGEDGSVEFVAEWVRDITELKEKESQLRENEKRLHTLISNTPAIIYSYRLVDGTPQMTYINENVKHVLGFEPEDFIGNHTFFKERLHPEEVQKVFDAIPEVLTKGRVALGEYRVKNKRGQYRWVHDEQRLVTHEDGTQEVIGGWIDITDRKEAEEKIRYMSFHDNLTGLYNRHFMEEEMQRLDTTKQLPISIIMTDVDGLKLVNDTYGHAKGDEMLKRVADVLRDSFREQDLIVRWGGDECVIFMPQTTSETARAICKRIEDNCRKANVEDIPISLTWGAATKDTMDKDTTIVLRAAEDEMYKNKLTRSRSARSAVVDALINTLEVKSHETEKHWRTIQAVAVRIGEKLELSETELSRVRLLSTLHDIGKISTPEKLLLKKGPLSDEEWKVMKKHPETGWRIARGTDEFVHVADDILSHHERWDGKGYPRELKEEDISLPARIVAIADAYEVMKEGRPYQEAKSEEEIVAEFKKCAGTQFDPELVEIFLSVLEE